MLTIDENEYELVVLVPKASKRFSDLDEHEKDRFLTMYGKRFKDKENVNPNEPVFMDDWHKDVEVYVSGARQPPFRSFELILDMSDTAYARYFFNAIKEDKSRYAEELRTPAPSI